MIWALFRYDTNIFDVTGVRETSRCMISNYYYFALRIFNHLVRIQVGVDENRISDGFRMRCMPFYTCSLRKSTGFTSLIFLFLVCRSRQIEREENLLNTSVGPKTTLVITRVITFGL